MVISSSELGAGTENAAGAHKAETAEIKCCSIYTLQETQHEHVAKMQNV